MSPRRGASAWSMRSVTVTEFNSLGGVVQSRLGTAPVVEHSLVAVGRALGGEGVTLVEGAVLPGCFFDVDFEKLRVTLAKHRDRVVDRRRPHTSTRTFART